MKNLKLLGKLQASDMVTLLLRTSRVGQLDYFIIIQSVNYSIVASGQCEGDIGGPQKSFNLLLSSLLSLINKGYSFRIQYKDDILSFITLDERLEITPLCVEFVDPNMEKVVSKLLRFNASVASSAKLLAQRARIEEELKEAQERYRSLALLNLSGNITSSNPFSENKATVELDKKFSSQIENYRVKLCEIEAELKSSKCISLKLFKTIALAAARAHEMVNFCEQYAIVQIGDSFLLQKGECPILSVQGNLLYQLINQGNGDGFFWFENSLTYTEGELERTTVFIEKYLPSISVDSSIITRGAVKEKYTTTLKDVLAVTQLMRSKFPEISFDMGEGRLVLSNDKGENITTTFDVKAETPELNRQLRGEEPSKPICMSTIKIPIGVQSLLSFFRGNTIIYVKERKIIFQSEALYLVFGR